MKIGIISFHFAWNYGAALQCFALKKTIEKMGHEVQVIDYRPNYHMNKYSLFPKPLLEAKKACKTLGNDSRAKIIYLFLRRFLSTILELRHINIRWKTKKAFEKFQGEYFSSIKCYKTIKGLRKDPPDCDILICGSDQLWNPTLTYGVFDPAYFLDFGKSFRKIAYAISACNWRSSDNANGLLKNLDAISLRESDMKDEIGKLYEKEIDICPDPTLLLNENEYKPLEKSDIIPREPYILVYLLWNGYESRIYAEIVRQLNSDGSYLVINISPCHLKPNIRMKEYRGIAPGAWLWLISNASYVITNSFHCLSFSIIYHKDVFVVPCSHDTMYRLLELCKNSDIEDHMILTMNDVKNALAKDIDYNKREEIIDTFKAKGLSYLARNIECTE